MRLTGVKFRLKHLMIAVAAIACFLVLLQSPGGFLVICVLWSLVLAVIFWALLRGQRRPAAVCFGIASLAVNGLFAALSIYALNLWGFASMFVGLLCGVPLVLGSGTAWSVAATRRGAARQLSPFAVWPLVAVLATLPLTMLLAQWPLRLAFLASRPALDRLADAVATGQAPGWPARAGFFMVVNSAVDPTTGNVGLITDPNPSGRSGFVRVNPAGGVSPVGLGGPFHNLGGDLPMGGGWRYQSED